MPDEQNEIQLAEVKAKVVILRRAERDADAIAAAGGLLAIMATQAARMADDWFHMWARAIDNPAASAGRVDKMGAEFLDESAKVLESIRTKLAAAADELGEFFNNRDATSETMQALSTPVFELLRKCEVNEPVEV